MPPSKNISFEELSQYFHLPINQVAKELGVCATILKKICRRNGIPRWPHRKLKSLEKMISNLEQSLTKAPADMDEVIQEIDILRAKRKEIMHKPDILGKAEFQATLGLATLRGNALLSASSASSHPHFGGIGGHSVVGNGGVGGGHMMSEAMSASMDDQYDDGSDIEDLDAGYPSERPLVVMPVTSRPEINYCELILSGKMVNSLRASAPQNAIELPEPVINPTYQREYRPTTFTFCPPLDFSQKLPALSSSPTSSEEPLFPTMEPYVPPPTPNNRNYMPAMFRF